MPEDQLPVELPNDVKLSDRGPSPLAQAENGRSLAEFYVAVQLS